MRTRSFISVVGVAAGIVMTGAALFGRPSATDSAEQCLHYDDHVCRDWPLGDSRRPKHSACDHGSLMGVTCEPGFNR